MSIIPIETLQPEHIGEIISIQYIPYDPNDSKRDTLQTDQMSKIVGTLRSFKIDRKRPQLSLVYFEGHENGYYLTPQSGDRVELYLHTRDDTKPSGREGFYLRYFERAARHLRLGMMIYYNGRIEVVGGVTRHSGTGTTTITLLGVKGDSEYMSHEFDIELDAPITVFERSL